MANQSDYPVGRSGAEHPAAPPPPYPEGTSTEQIRRDIRRTRQDMDETVDTLEERLRPRHLIDDFLDMFRSSGAADAAGSAKQSFKDAGYKVVEKLKQHPMPAALIGAGLVWLLFDDDGKARLRSYEPRKWDVPEHSGSYVDARTGQPYPAGRSGDGAGQQQQPSMAEQAKDKLSGVGEGISDSARAVGQTVGQWSESARDGIGSAAQGVRHYASSASEQLSRGYESSKHYVERGMEEYPLAIGAAAMALGVIGGLCLPRTRTEDRLMGDAADQVKQRAVQVGEEAIESGKQVARDAGDAVQGEGITPGKVAEKVKRVAKDVKETISESARREGIDPQSLSHKGQKVAERVKDSAEEQAAQKAPQQARPKRRDTHSA